MIPLDEAQRFVLAACPPLERSSRPLEGALGAVLAAPVVTREAVPPFDNTAMDGFAVRAADTLGAPRELPVVATLAAGAAPGRAVGPGEAIRIMTGAPMPAGADAIVIVETTEEPVPGRVRILETVQPGEHVRRAGTDLRPGQEVFPAGTVLGPGHVGVLASLGHRHVETYRTPRVGVLSTGDELVDDARPLAPGQIRDSNRPALLAAAAASGFEAVDLGLVRDDPAALEAALSTAATRVDAILTSGGVSVGDFDHTKRVLGALAGDTMRWMQVAIRPAKPFAFGRIGRVPVFGLPGNPVSSLVSFELFARPALRQMAGHTALFRPRSWAILDDGYRRVPDGKLHFVRVRLTRDGAHRLRATSAGGQSSHQLLAMAVADGLALVPDGHGIEPGGEVEVLVLGEG